MSSTTKGFTLIEILIFATIITLLVTIAVNETKKKKSVPKDSSTNKQWASDYSEKKIMIDKKWYTCKEDP